MSEYTEAQLDAIDRLVAEKVMGWTLSASSPTWNADDGSPPMPTVPVWVKAQHPWDRIPVAEWRPTRDNGQAMEVFEHEDDMQLRSYRKKGNPLRYRVWYAGRKEEILKGVHVPPWEADASTPRLAICLAALKRKGVEVQP